MVSKEPSEPATAWHFHEAMHCMHILAEMFDERIYESVAVQSNEELRDRAVILSDQLHAFYQEIARARWDHTFAIDKED